MSIFFLGTVFVGILSSWIDISEIHVLENTYEIIRFDDAKITSEIEGTISFSVLNQLFISCKSSYSAIPLSHDLVFFDTPVLFVLLGCICASRIHSEKHRTKSLIPRKICDYIQLHPGCSQKQLVAGLMLSRGSICYHLYKLKNAGKLIQLSRNGSTLYYLAGMDTGDKFEQTLSQLLTRKKSGKFLQVLYDHPYANRVELAEFLGLSPETLRWYLRRYAREGIVLVEMVGTKCYYSFTPKARKIYEHLLMQHNSHSGILRL
ncbi:MAG TPA: winged helix-turn-helix transcriptional regulator [Methanocorpusculum sp.]|nr:winged helix-turn-helix transcriptional regulator [Methanocorpusculum sp.]